MVQNKKPPTFWLRDLRAKPAMHAEWLYDSWWPNGFFARDLYALICLIWLKKKPQISLRLFKIGIPQQLLARKPLEMRGPDKPRASSGDIQCIKKRKPLLNK